MTYALAAAAVAIGLVSCAKAKLPEAEQEKEQEKPQQGLRTLTVSFAAGTKTTPTLGTDGETQPVWAEGDKISLNGVVYNVPPEAVGEATCTITTDIQGSINAVYPADAYKAQSPYYKVSDQQDGSFGSANICYAQVGSGETTIRFNNVTAVFEVEVPAHTNKLVVTSLGEIDATTGRRGTTVRPINSTGSNDAAKQKITVSVADSNDPTTCYVSVLVDENNPVLLTNLNFDAVTGDNTGTQGGVSPSYIKSKGKDPLTYKVAVNTIYTPELHEYVKIGGKKWATRNVGATADKGPDSYGRYFMWGETTGLTSDKINNTNFPDEKYYSADNENEWSKDGCFCWNNCPWTDGAYEDMNFRKVFTKYIPSDSDAAIFSKDGKADGKTTLDLVDDAAWFNWGGAWRMPTQEEFDLLRNLTNSWETNYNDSGVNGNKFTDAGNSIFLPAAGSVDGTCFKFAGEGGCYWSSSLYTNGPNNAYCLTTHLNDVYVLSQYFRYEGLSVRALSE